MSTRPLIVSFVGPSGVGKTTVIEQLIALIRARGLTVGTVKHTPHGHEVDKIGSDSWRHRQAGADAVLLAGAAGAVIFLAPAHGNGDTGAHHSVAESEGVNHVTELVAAHLGHVDVVLAEGFAALHDRIILVHRTAIPQKEPRTPANLWLTISDEPKGSREVGFDDLSAVALLIVQQASGD